MTTKPFSIRETCDWLDKLAEDLAFSESKACETLEVGLPRARLLMAAIREYSRDLHRVKMLSLLGDPEQLELTL